MTMQRINVLQTYYHVRWFISRRLSSMSKRQFKVLDGRLQLSSEQRDKYIQVSNTREEDYLKKMNQVLEGGGKSAIVRHTQRNKKLLARERIKLLIDSDYAPLEIAPFAGLNMEYGNICCAGNICVIAKVGGQLCIIGANDATVKGGTVYPIGVKKQLRMQEIAAENNLPCLYLMDSGGGFLPLQAEVFPGKEHGGRVFYNEAIMNSRGIPQVCVVAGSCTAGAAYIPTMANEVIMVEKIGTIFLGGPPLVYAAIGEKISDQDLGGAGVHCDVSGCADYRAKDEYEAIEMTKDVMSALNMEVFLNTSKQHVEEPFYDENDLPLLSVARNETGMLDIRKILSRIIDGSRFHEYKPTYGQEILAGLARVNGILVGIVANNGISTPNACLKGSNFVSLCNHRGIPILFLQDIIETSDKIFNTNLIKYQSKLISAIATSKVPKITVVLGDSFGVGNYAMCGRSMSPRFLFLWPAGRVSLDHFEIMNNDANAYGNNVTMETSCYYSSSHIWDDGVILPQDTRKVISQSLTACLMHQSVERASEQNVIRM